MDTDRQDAAQPGPLLTAVDMTVEALPVAPFDAGLIALARTLAKAIDDMDAETRSKMLGQTAGQLARVLAQLSKESRSRPGLAVRPSRKRATVRF